MATYTELRTLVNDGTLKDKVSIALLVASEAIRTEDAGTANHANRLKYAKKVLTDPDGNADDMLRALLAQNASASLATITGASDATIQTAVNAAVNIFADGS
jgi:hypothetical protein